MPLSYFVTLIQCLTLGVVISLLFIALLLKQRNGDTTTKIGVALGVCFCAVYLRTAAELVFSSWNSLDGWLFWVGTRIPAAMLALLPALLIWAWRRSTVLEWRSAAGRLLLIGAGVSAAGLLLTLALVHGDPLSLKGVDRALALNRALWLIPAFSSILQLPLDARLKTFMKVTAAAYLSSFLLTLYWTVAFTQNSPPYFLLTSLLQIGTFSSLLASFVIVARFRFADVFVRWSVCLVLLGTLSVIVTRSFIYVDYDVSVAKRPLGYLLCGLELLCFLTGGVPLARWCVKWIDSHILQRFDLREAAGRLQSIMSDALDKQAMFAVLEAEIAKLMEVKSIRIVPSHIGVSARSGDDRPLKATGIFGKEAALGHGHLAHFDFAMPINSDDGTDHCIGVSVGSGRQSLTNGELLFLNDAAHQAGVRLRRMTVEAVYRNHALREASLRQQVAEAELRALRAQVNPHFLFNSLNTIADLIVSAPKNAEHMTLSLSKVFRHLLDQADRQFVSVKEEFEFLRHYLDIEQTRFGEDFQVQLAVDSEIAHVLVPTLLLQPLVENAIRHGLARKGGQRRLTIRAASQSSSMLLEVIDDGVGFETTFNPPSSKGVGLANTRSRLLTVYGEAARLHVDSAPMRGCRVSMDIPLAKVDACEV